MSNTDLEKTLNQFHEEKRLDDIETLLSKTSGCSEITWEDVSGEISINTWGKCIENKIVEKKGSSYIMKNRGDIATIITEKRKNENVEDETLDPSGLTFIDKSVGIFLVLFIGIFSYDQLRFEYYDSLDIFFQHIYGPTNMYIFIILMALITSIWSKIVRNTVDSHTIGEYMSKIKELDEDTSFYSVPDDVDGKIKEEISSLQYNMFKDQIKPYIWVLIITIPIILWINTNVMIVATHPPLSIPFLTDVYLSDRFLGPIRLWLFIYILFSIVFGRIMNKYI